MAAATLSVSTTTTPASRPSPKPNEGATKSRGRPASREALGDRGIPGGPEVYSTRCPALPRLRMRESREIVHRAVLRAKGLDPDLVPSPSKHADARGPRFGEGNETRAGPATTAKPSPRGRSPPPPPYGDPSAGDLDRARSCSRAETPKTPKRLAPLASSVATDDATEDARDLPRGAGVPKKKQGLENLFLEDVELETLLPKSRGGVGGGGGGDFTRGVGATHFLRVRHEVRNERFERRVRLALVDPRAAPEVDAVDAASERSGTKIVPRATRARRARRGVDDERRIDALGRGARPLPKGASPCVGGSEPGVAKAPAKAPARPARPARLARLARLAPSRARAAGSAAAEAAAAGRGIGLGANSDRSRHAMVASGDPGAPLGCLMSPRDARVSASLRALVAEAPAHVAAAVDEVAATARARAKQESRAAAARVRFLAAARNAACDRNAKTSAELERLRDELDRARRTNRGSAEGSKASGSRTDRLRDEIDATRGFAEEEAERAKTREHVASRLRETVVRLRRGVERSRETIAECDADVSACRAYADAALRSERSAGAALEWIKKKYLLKANAWKQDLEAQKAIREALAEDVRELRAADRRRGARAARARAASEASAEVRKEKEDSDRARRDLETRSEDLAKSNMIRLAVAVGLARPETRTPDAIVEAVNASERRRAEALGKVEELQAKETETWRVLAERRERLRKTRLGVFEDEPEENPESESAAGDVSGGDVAAETSSCLPREPAAANRRSPEDLRDLRDLRDLDLELGRADRSLARKFTRFRRVAARLVAVDEGLKKIDDAVARTLARVGSPSDSRPPRDRRGALGVPRARLRASTLGRPPIDRASALGFPAFARTLGRPSVGGRAAEARKANATDGGRASRVSTPGLESGARATPPSRSGRRSLREDVFEGATRTSPRPSPSRRSSDPASPSAAGGGDARGGRPGSAASTASAASAVSAARPRGRVSRADPFDVFDRLSRRRGERMEKRNADADGVSRGVFGAPEKRASRLCSEDTEDYAEDCPEDNAEDDAEDDTEEDTEDVEDDAASVATRALASALPARFENTAKSVIEVLVSIPRGADGSPARASAVLGGARDAVSGDLRGGLAGYPSADARARRTDGKQRESVFRSVARPARRPAAVSAVRAPGQSARSGGRGGRRSRAHALEARARVPRDGHEVVLPRRTPHRGRGGQRRRAARGGGRGRRAAVQPSRG